MLDSENLVRIMALLPGFDRDDPELLRAFGQQAYYARIPAGKDIFAVGDMVGAIALLMGGSVRVYKIGDTGREITLYRFSAGESCILSANAILNDQSFSAIATVEEEAEAIMIPAEVFRDWVRRYDFWREFVFNLLSQRLASLMEIVDEVAFRRLDARVATLLLERSLVENPLTVTHQEVAAELGSSREVISRILGHFANQGLIRIGRGEIEVLDAPSLDAYRLT